LSTTHTRRSKESALDNEPTKTYSGLPRVGENRPLVDIEADAAREREQQRQAFLGRELERQMQLTDETPTFRGSGFVPVTVEDLVYR
jgi:hypothetical protein